MTRVLGIGGVFLKAKDPDALRAWYQKHLHLDVQDWGGAAFQWSRPDGPGEKGTTIWSVFPDDSNYFAPSRSPFMINYIVDDLSAVLSSLRDEGCAVDEKTEESEFGKFGWVMDLEGNRIELWEPPESGI